MTISVVQNKAAQTSATTSHTVTLNTAPTQNNLILVAIKIDIIDEAVSNVTGPTGYAKDVVKDRGTGSVAIWSKVAGASESGTITFTTTLNQTADLEAMEVSGNATSSVLDKTNKAEGASGNTIQPGTTGTLSQADEIAFTASLQAGTNGGSEAIDSGFTVLDAATFTTSITGYLIVSATTALNPTHSWTTNRARAAVIATYKAAAAGIQRGLGGIGVEALSLPSSGAVTIGGWIG